MITCKVASAPPSVAFAHFARSLTGRDELARFSYSECGLRSLRLLTQMGVMSSLASATPSVLMLASLAHSHGCDEVGRERDYIRVIT